MTITQKKGKAMKKFSRVVKMGLLVTGFVMFSYGFSSGLVWAQEDIAKHPDCPYCGMDRGKFSHSRMYIEYDDNASVGLCSLHCADLDLALKIDKTPTAIRVGDYNQKKLIDAEKAFWVIGGDKMGVMTARAKWAFENKKDAEIFIHAHGGISASFDDAVNASFEDMNNDIKMIRKKRKMKKK